MSPPGCAMNRLALPLFSLLVLADAAVLALMFVLGLAAAKPSHTPVLSVIAFFAVPAALLAGLVWLFLRGPGPAARPVALVLAGLPALLIVGGALLSSGAAWWMGERDDGGRPDAQLQQRLESAIASNEAATVARIAADPRAPINPGAALVAAVRAMEAPPHSPEPLRALLQAGVKPDSGGGPESPLEAAIRVSGAAGAAPVRLLLDAGADPNHRYASQPAWFAALSARTDPAVLPLLLARGADLRGVDMAGNGPLYWAVFHRHWPALLLLLEHGADPAGARLPDGQSLRPLVQTERRRQPADPTLAALERRLQGGVDGR